MSPAGTRCHHSSGRPPVARAPACQDPAASEATAMTATPIRLSYAATLTFTGSRAGPPG